MDSIRIVFKDQLAQETYKSHVEFNLNIDTVDIAHKVANDFAEEESTPLEYFIENNYTLFGPFCTSIK